MKTLTLSEPQAVLHHGKRQAKAAASFLRQKRARAKLAGRRRMTKAVVTRNWIDDLEKAIEQARAVGLPTDKRKTQPLWLQGGDHASVNMVAPLKIAFIVCDSVLRPYETENEDDLDDEHKPPSFQTVAAAIGRALGVCGRNSAGYIDRRQAKRQREQVGLELLQIAASIGLINPLKNPKAKRTGKGDKRSDMQRVELSDEAQRDIAAIQGGSHTPMTSAPIRFYSRPRRRWWTSRRTGAAGMRPRRARAPW